MSDFLDINGIPVSVADGSAIMSAPEDIGDEARAVDGTLVKMRVALKQQYGWTTTPMVASPDAYAWKALINGYGHHWSFDSSIYSGKGLGFASGSNYQQNNSGGKYGGDLQVDTTGNSANQIVLQPSGLDLLSNSLGFTVMCWIRAQDGVTWNWYLITSGGQIYKNGVLASADADSNCIILGAPLVELAGYGVTQNGPATLAAWQATHTYAANFLVQPTAAHANGHYFKVTAGGGGNSGASEPTWPSTLGNTVVDGALTWTDQGPLSLFVDDLVLLPFTLPTSWISALYTFMSGQAYPDNPKLYVSGLMPLQSNLCIGSVGETKLIQGMNAGVFTQNLQTIAFTLKEA